jgi:hypothetical protein
MALLTPVSVAGYALGLPLAVLSAAVVIAALAGAADLLRAARISRPLSHPGVASVVGTLVVLADLWLSTRRGTHFGGDAGFHVGRVKLLLDHGFNQTDPISGLGFEPIYHTSLYHALMASAAQLTGQDAPGAWAFTFAFSKLAVACGSYYLAWTLCRERWIAWVAAVIASVWVAPYAVLTYPNTVAAYWLFPLSAALAVELLDAATTRNALKVAALSLTAAQLHPLYFAFVALILGPVLGIGAVARLRGDRAAARALLLGALTLALGLPWLAVARIPALRPDTAPRTHGPYPAVAALAPEPEDDTEPVDEAEPPREKGFIYLSGGQMMYSPRRFANPRSPHALVLFGIALGLASAQRRRFALLAAPVCVVVAILHVPPVCTALVELSRSPFIMKRLDATFTVIHPGVLAAGALAWTTTAVRGAWLALAQALALCLGGYYAHVRGVDSRHYDRQEFLSPRRSAEALQDTLANLRKRRELLDTYVPSGATIWAPLQQDYRVAMFCDCFVMATDTDHGTRGLQHIGRRRRDAARLIDPDVPEPLRRALLRYYGIERMYVNKGRIVRRIRKAYPGALEVHRVGGARAIVIRDR